MALQASGAAQDRAAGDKTITAADLGLHLRTFAGPELEGRDTPSAGLTRAQDYVAEAWFKAGVGLPPDLPPLAADLAADARRASTLAAYRRTYPVSLPEPDPEGSSLALEVAGAAPRAFALLPDFVPLAHAEGEARGEIDFVGYGIESEAEKFDEIPAKGLKGKIALLVEGEPRTPKRFEGPELSADADLWQKLVALRKAGAEGALVVRRSPVVKSSPPPAPNAKDIPPAALSFRYTWADWNDARAKRESHDPEKLGLLPALQISIQAASEILGEDVEALAEKIDASVRPLRREAKGRVIALRSKTRRVQVDAANLVGWIAGGDPKLASEVVIVGAHLDHIGVDARGRIGTGADDNASGSAALLEIAQALCVAKPKRSVLVCSFSGEEDGLLGSKAIAARLPVDAKSVVAMLNMDMLGFGDKDNCAVLGIVQNPTLEKVIARGLKLSRTGIKDVTMRQGEELWQRSDHYSFHQIGVPTLFFFEGLPLEKNPDYHTWRDTLDKLDQEKVLNITRLAYNCTWLFTDDANRPPPPSASR
ncbi:MAG TPA: M28 family peptidase [Planctomycetota bacterium]|nr:M28 family peptidase [Planctomycetota bacterium]